MTDLVQTFLKNTYSVAQIRTRLNVLKTYLLGYFFNSQAQNTLSEENKRWIESLDPNFLKHFTATNVNQELENLDKQLKQITPLIIYVPVEIPEEEIDKIGTWVRANFSDNMVIDIKYDGNLIGGAAVSWKGVYHDLSLRALIDQNKTQIIESLKKYLT